MTLSKDHWPTIRFGDVVRNVNENSQDPLADGFERYVSIADLEPENLHIRSWGSIAEDGTSFTRVFRRGQVLFSKRRAYQRKAAVAEFDGICSGDLLVFEAKKGLLPELLPFIVQSDGFYEHALATSAGSLSPRTKWKDLANYTFALPPLDEQRRIAEILWAADEVEQATVEAISHIKETKRVSALDLFSFSTIQNNPSLLPSTWKVGQLRDIATINPQRSAVADDTAVSFVSMDMVSEEGGIVEQETRVYSEVRNGYTHFANGDILLAKITPCLENGKGALAQDLVNGIGCGSTEFIVIRPHRQEDAEFIYQLTMTPFFRFLSERMMQGTAGQRRVPVDYVEKFRMAIPPAGVRRKIGIILTQFDLALEEQKQHAEMQQNVKHHLLEMLLRGV